jgi:hypothetical protein
MEREGASRENPSSDYGRSSYARQLTCVTTRSTQGARPGQVERPHPVGHALARVDVRPDRGRAPSQVGHRDSHICTCHVLCHDPLWVKMSEICSGSETGSGRAVSSCGPCLGTCRRAARPRQGVESGWALRLAHLYVPHIAS